MISFNKIAIPNTSLQSPPKQSTPTPKFQGSDDLFAKPVYDHNPFKRKADMLEVAKEYKDSYEKWDKESKDSFWLKVAKGTVAAANLGVGKAIEAHGGPDTAPYITTAVSPFINSGIEKVFKEYTMPQIVQEYQCAKSHAYVPEYKDAGASFDKMKYKNKNNHGFFSWCVLEPAGELEPLVSRYKETQDGFKAKQLPKLVGYPFTRGELIPFVRQAHEEARQINDADLEYLAKGTLYQDKDKIQLEKLNLKFDRNYYNRGIDKYEKLWKAGRHSNRYELDCEIIYGHLIPSEKHLDEVRKNTKRIRDHYRDKGPAIIDYLR